MNPLMVQLDDGEFLFVASHDELDEALQLIEGLRAYWPREYVLRDSNGNDLRLTRYTAKEPVQGDASPVW